MTHFTESPYEGLMGQEPEAARPAPPPEPPAGNRCRGCPYGKARPCVGFCIKELAGEQKNWREGKGKERNLWEKEREG